MHTMSGLTGVGLAGAGQLGLSLGGRKTSRSASSHGLCSRQALRLMHRISASSKGGMEEQKQSAEVYEDLVSQVLRSPEAQASVKKLKLAAERVEAAKRALAALDEEEAALASKTEPRVGAFQQAQLAADSEVLEAISGLSEAAEDLRKAEALLQQRRQATLELGSTSMQERLESSKAALASGMTCAAVSLPFTLSTPSSLLGLATNEAVLFVTGALFGVCYRYIVRRDQNVQLPLGAVGAFGLTRGLAQLGTLVDEQGLDAFSLQRLLPLGECIIIFGFCSLTLEFLFRTEAVSRFPMDSQRD